MKEKTCNMQGFSFTGIPIIPLINEPQDHRTGPGATQTTHEKFLKFVYMGIKSATVPP